MRTRPVGGGGEGWRGEDYDGEYDDDTLLQAAVDAAEAYAPEEVRTLGRWLLLSPDERAEAFGHVCDARGTHA